MTTYLEPAAARYLAALSETARTAYLKKNTWITWSGGTATFTWADFLGHVGTRLKGIPAFDSFTLSNAENIEFGDATANARHFTLYSQLNARMPTSAVTSVTEVRRTASANEATLHMRVSFHSW